MSECKHENTAAASAINTSSVWCPDCEQWVRLLEGDDGKASPNDCVRHGWRGPNLCPYCRGGSPEFEECHHGATGFCSDCYEEGFGD